MCSTAYKYPAAKLASDSVIQSSGDLDPSDALNGMEWVGVTIRTTDYRFMLDGTTTREENEVILIHDPATVQLMGNWVTNPAIVMGALQTSAGIIRGYFYI